MSVLADHAPNSPAITRHLSVNLWPKVHQWISLAVRLAVLAVTPPTEWYRVNALHGVNSVHWFVRKEPSLCIVALAMPHFELWAGPAGNRLLQKAVTSVQPKWMYHIRLAIIKLFLARDIEDQTEDSSPSKVIRIQAHNEVQTHGEALVGATLKHVLWDARLPVDDNIAFLDRHEHPTGMSLAALRALSTHPDVSKRVLWPGVIPVVLKHLS